MQGTVANDSVPCPSCGTPMERAADHGVSYACPSCGGCLFGLYPFEQKLGDGVGARVWVAASSGQPAGRCPFCANAMTGPGPETGTPAGMAVCHTCQEVWVPASAADWMAANASSRAVGAGLPGPVPTGGPAQPSECGNCGAPFEPDESGRCRYCQTQIAAPTPVVVEVVQPAPTPLFAARGLIGGLAAALTESID